MLTTFSFGVSSNLSQQKSPTAEIRGICFFEFSEETPNEKVVNMSKLTNPYFSEFEVRKHPAWLIVIAKTTIYLYSGIHLLVLLLPLHYVNLGGKTRIIVEFQYSISFST